jgi:(p)ppGpp synthase/HD superfamily hydrolase
MPTVRHEVDPLLGDRFEDALVYALDAHRQQTRKGSPVPYVSHLLGVCSLVLEHGGGEDQAIAGLLHDVVEDQGGLPRLADVDERFGPEVARLVEALSDSVTDEPDEKLPWLDRKVDYLAHLEHQDADVLLVSAADKLHNARTILVDRRREGEVVFERFSPVGEHGAAEGTRRIAWYYRSLADVFTRRLEGPGAILAVELALTVDELFAGIEDWSPPPVP